MAKIMLVEDDNNLREIYEARLQAEGYTLVSAKDGEEALVMAKNEQPDLIISDVMMPKVSGFEMLDILRNTDGLKEVKVVMLTALGQSDDQARADRLGADRYLVKSQVTLEDIVKVTHELLNDTPEVIASPAVPVTVESMPMVSPPTAEPVAPVINVVTASPEVTPVMTPAAPSPNLTSTADQIITQTSAEEQANVAAEIQNFVVSSPVETVTMPPTQPSADSASTTDDQVMANAIDTLVASTPAATPLAETETLVTNAVEPQIDTPMTPQIITPTQAIDGNVPIAHKKVISPLDAEPVAAKPDLNELLALENAKEQALSEAAAPETPTDNQEPALPFDPNNVAL